MDARWYPAPPCVPRGSTWVKSKIKKPWVKHMGQKHAVPIGAPGLRPGANGES